MRVRPRIWLLMVTAGVLAMTALSACSTSAARSSALPTPTKGDVQVAVDRATYTANQPIGVTVTSGKQTSYYALDGRSGCTFLQLEQYDQTHNTWVSVDGCPTTDPPQARLIAPSIVEPFTLAPGNSASNQNSWVPGLYRVALQYGTQSDGGGHIQIAYSAGFRIVS